MATSLPVGDADCQNGGSSFSDGTTTTFACTGATGPAGRDGVDGAPGPAGPAGTSIVATSLPVGDPDCQNGGASFTDGVTTTFACNGADGPPGPAGARDDNAVYVRSVALRFGQGAQETATALCDTAADQLVSGGCLGVTPNGSVGTLNCGGILDSQPVGLGNAAARDGWTCTFPTGRTSCRAVVYCLSGN